MVIKAFELVEVIGNISSAIDKPLAKIECIECSERVLFIGTTDGGIAVYSVEEIPDSNGEITFSTKRECYRQLDSRKPVTNIKTASALSRVLILCDATIHLLDMNGLNNSGIPIRGMTTFCVNENPNVANPFCIQICCAVAGKRQLRVMDITDDQVAHVKDIPISEPAVSLAFDGANICAALQSQYTIYNFQEGTSQTLFTFDNTTLTPFMRRITKDEFLVNAPEGLGMFVSTEGTSLRPPVAWAGGSAPTGLAYANPYVLSLTPSGVAVHSILDQQLQQQLPFPSPKSIGNFDGTVFGASRTSVFKLVAVPWEQQVLAALETESLEQALHLIENATNPGMSGERLAAARRRLTQSVGFAWLSRAEWATAQDLLTYSGVDPCEVITLFPGLMPASSPFVRAAPPLHAIADVHQLFAREPHKLEEANLFLKQFLEDVRFTAAAQHRREEIDTALVKLCAVEWHDELAALVSQGQLRCRLTECRTTLHQAGAHHALALMHQQQGDIDQALAIWARIIHGQLADETFPGLEFFVDALANVSEEALVWKYAELLVSIDVEAGVAVFKRGAASEIVPDSVLRFLQPHPDAALKYLEYLVLEKELGQASQVAADKGPATERFHTRLAVLYLDEVTRLLNETDQDEPAVFEARNKLRNLLRSSTAYQVPLLLSRVQDAQLHQETAILFGKLEKHEEALDILVHKLKDFKGAEEYCTIMSSAGSDDAFQLLLKTYLNPNLLASERDEYLEPALRLLDTRAAQLNPTKVLEMIPSEWNIAVVESFVRVALRGSLNKYRTSKMVASLARGENLQQKCLLHGLERHSVPLYATNYCCVCKQPFPEPTFARFPNDVLVHPECVRHTHICPVTGRNFLPIGGQRSRR